MTSIGEKIRELRRQRGMTQSSLGQGIVSASMMSQIESGRTRPSYTLLKSIANKLDVPVEYFLNDLEDHFATSARLQLAEFWFLTQQYEKVFGVLNDMPIPEPPGADYFLYRFLLARLYRTRGDYDAAVETLEELREYGLRTLDERILFSVMKESGYVEAEMSNPMGAEHEWKMALETGKKLSSARTFSMIHYNAELAEVCLQLSRLLARSEKHDEAQSYLIQAKEFSAGHASYLEIAQALAKEGLASLEEDAGKSRSLIDAAVHLIHFTSFVEQHILVKTQLNTLVGEGTKTLDDPWDAAAKATTLLHPARFIQGEIQRIEQLLLARQASVALQRIGRCYDIIEDYRKEDGQFLNGDAYELIDLKLAEAQAALQLDDSEYALTILLQLLEDEAIQQHKQQELRACRLLLKAADNLADSARFQEIEQRVRHVLLTAP